MVTKETRYCDCELPAKWAIDPNYPIGFDEEVNEYYLETHQGNGKACIYYCFFCGGRMPDSKRADLFTTPSEAEKAEVGVLLRGIVDVEGMVSALGEPDVTFDWEKPIDEEFQREVYNLQVWKKQYRYTSKWKTLDLSMSEMEDGRLHYFITGKSIRSQNATSGAGEA